MELRQISKQFDPVTMRKIAKGATITAFYSVTVFLLTILKTQDFGDAFVNGLVVQLVPTALNILKEWYEGETVNFPTL